MTTLRALWYAIVSIWEWLAVDHFWATWAVLSAIILLVPRL